MLRSHRFAASTSVLGLLFAAACSSPSTPSDAAEVVDAHPPLDGVVDARDDLANDGFDASSGDAAMDAPTADADLDAGADAGIDAPAIDSGPDDAADGASPDVLVDGADHDALVDDVLNADASVDASDASDAAIADASDASVGVRVRIVAGNLTSGTAQSYTPGEGIRILRGLAPDVAVIQEFNYGSNSLTDLRTFVDTTFGTHFQYVRGTGNIPNGVVSRYPFVQSGEWVDPSVSDRSFVWARIDVPGPRDLWAVSLHLLTSSTTARTTEANNLVTLVNAAVPTSDYLVLGGDLNTSARTETCVTTLASIVDTSAPYPADQNGNVNTSAPRTRPYDWVLADSDLRATEVPVAIGANRFAGGLVFDTRVYMPLSDAAPALLGDSGALNMQHMAVARDFVLSP